ncbi:hypothetical protein PSEUDO9AZ_40171 [Pseudomonas sp. 9AZ]|nr:hypothetical protein PSEUDO9AZ_40171 [Pseudomonas sp. 9AZ]
MTYNHFHYSIPEAVDLSLKT